MRPFSRQDMSEAIKWVSCRKTILDLRCFNLFITCFNLVNFLRPLTFQLVILIPGLFFASHKYGDSAKTA